MSVVTKSNSVYQSAEQMFKNQNANKSQRKPEEQSLITSNQTEKSDLQFYQQTGAVSTVNVSALGTQIDHKI